MYHPPHCLVSGNELVGAGTALEAPVDTLRLVVAPESMVPPGDLQWQKLACVFEYELWYFKQSCSNGLETNAISSTITSGCSLKSRIQCNGSPRKV